MPVGGSLKAGKISKPNGLQGHVTMILEPGSGKLIKTDNPLFIDIDGQRVPYFVEDFDQVSSELAIVKFEFINSIEEARDKNGCELFFDSSQTSSSQPELELFHTLVGFGASDTDLGHLGKVTRYIHHEMNPVLVVDFKGRELLIPAVRDLVAEVNPEEQTILFNLPEGLTSL